MDLPSVFLSEPDIRVEIAHIASKNEEALIPVCLVPSITS